MARAREVGLGGEEEADGAFSRPLMQEEDEEEELSGFSVSVPGLLPSETSPSASRSQPSSSNTMSKEEEVQSPWQRRGHSSKEWGVSEASASASAWLSRSDVRLSCRGPREGPRDTPPAAAPPATLDDVSALGPNAATGVMELDTATLTDSASMWSGCVSGQSVVLQAGGGRSVLKLQTQEMLQVLRCFH